MTVDPSTTGTNPATPFRPGKKDTLLAENQGIIRY